MLTRGVAVVEIVFSDCPDPCAISSPAGISSNTPTAFAPLLIRKFFSLSTVLIFLSPITDRHTPKLKRALLPSGCRLAPDNRAQGYSGVASGANQDIPE